jgi:DNA modification methylase
MREEMPSKCVNLIVTSPPYYNQRDYATWKTWKEYIEVMKEVMKECCRITKGIICWNVGDDREFDLRSYSSVALQESGWQYQDTIVWDKKSQIGSRGVHIAQSRIYTPNFRAEEIFVYRNVDKMPKIEVEDIPVLSKTYNTHLWAITNAHASKKSHHIGNASMPKTLASLLIKAYSKKGDVVFDPYAGSGTTLVCAKDCGRHYVGTEYVKENVEVCNSKLGQEMLF